MDSGILDLYRFKSDADAIRFSSAVRDRLKWTMFIERDMQMRQGTSISDLLANLKKQGWKGLRNIEKLENILKANGFAVEDGFYLRLRRKTRMVYDPKKDREVANA